MSRSDATKKAFRQFFIYGMAAHTMGDAFAHSTLAKDSAGAIRPILHGKKLPNGEWDGSVKLPGADYVDVVPNRYKCAKVGVEQTMWNASVNASTGWYDFGMAARYGETWTGVHTFYMANILKHANDNASNKLDDWEAYFDFITYTAKTD